MKAHTSADRETADSTPPTGSSAFGSCTSCPGTTRIEPAKAISASTTLRPKTQDQLATSRIAPETSSPSRALPPATPAQAPTARSRSPAGKFEVMIESVVGMISAAPRPMKARIAIRVEGSLTVVAIAAPMPKIARPASSTRRRPSRSPRAPAGSSSPAKTSAYASTIH